MFGRAGLNHPALHLNISFTCYEADHEINWVCSSFEFVVLEPRGTHKDRSEEQVLGNTDGLATFTHNEVVTSCIPPLDQDKPCSLPPPKASEGITGRRAVQKHGFT